jgi:hypothetical protein
VQATLVTDDPAGFVAACHSPLQQLVGGEALDRLEGGIVTVIDAAGAPVMVAGGVRRTQTGLRWIRPDLDRRRLARAQLFAAARAHQAAEREAKRGTPRTT